MVVGSTRRYTDASTGDPVSAQPYGSWTAVMAYSAPAGMARLTRMSPWFSSRLCPAAPSAGVTDGQFAPSTGANRGSVPPVAANTAWASLALSPNALPSQVAGPAAPPVGAEAPEEGVAGVDRAGGAHGPHLTGGVGGQEDVAGPAGRGVGPLGGPERRPVGLAGQDKGSSRQQCQRRSAGRHGDILVSGRQIPTLAGASHGSARVPSGGGKRKLISATAARRAQ